MTEEELKNKIAFEEDPEAWMDEAERKFEERIEMINAVMAGKMGPENLSYSDLIIMELRTMQMLMEKYKREGKHCVLGDDASNFYN